MSIVFESSIGLHFEWVGGNWSQRHFLLPSYRGLGRRWTISDTTSIRTIRNDAIFRLFFVPFVSWLDTSFLVPLHNVSTHTVDHVPCLELFHTSQGDSDASFSPSHPQTNTCTWGRHPGRNSFSTLRINRSKTLAKEISH